MLHDSHDVTPSNVVVRDPVSVSALRGFAFFITRKITGNHHTVYLYKERVNGGGRGYLEMSGRIAKVCKWMILTLLIHEPDK